MNYPRCNACGGFHYGLSCAGQPLDIMHARALVYVGHAYSPWGAGYGKRQYTERRLPNGQELVCGKGLDDEYNAGRLFVALKSNASRDARLVTCPECARRLRAAGFKHIQETKDDGTSALEVG